MTTVYNRAVSGAAGAAVVKMGRANLICPCNQLCFTLIDGIMSVDVCLTFL